MTKAEAHLQRRKTRKARRAAERQAQRRREAVPANRGEAMVRELYKTVQHFFPGCSSRCANSTIAGPNRTTPWSSC